MTQKVFSVIDNFLSYKNNKTRRKGAFPQTTEEEKLEGKVGSCVQKKFLLLYYQLTVAS